MYLNRWCNRFQLTEKNMTEAVVSDIDDVEVSRVRNGGDWANFSLREWKAPVGDVLRSGDYGGELTVASSYGTWSYVWGSPGIPFKRFVVEHLAKDWHYTMKKLVGENNIRGFSLELTLKAARKRLLEKRREDGVPADRETAAQKERRKNISFARYSTLDIERYCTKELAAEAWEELNRCGTETGIQDILMNNRFIPIWGYEGFEYLRTDCHAWIEIFWRNLFIPYTKHLAEKIK